MTKDLALLVHGNDASRDTWLTTQAFLKALKRNLEMKLGD
jgi:isocitrate dehydrogenase